MSMSLNFTPDKWYMGAALRKAPQVTGALWEAYIEDGNTYRVVKLTAPTLADIKQKVKKWHQAEEERDARNRAALGE